MFILIIFYEINELCEIYETPKKIMQIIKIGENFKIK
jgi:hypothetical protein